MDLNKLYGKKVNITAKNERTFRGTVSDYFLPDENPSGIESILVDTDVGTTVEFYPEDIKTLKIEE